MIPRWGMMTKGTPQARITNHRITKQGVKPVSEGPVSEGKEARVAGASVTYAAIRYRNAAKGGPEARREPPPQGRGGAGSGPDSCSRRPRHGILSG